MDAERLKDVPLFAALSGHDREQIARWADEVEVETGRHLVDEGEFAHEFFVIGEGTADVIHEGEKITELAAGDYFGEIALTETDRRTASVVATSPMRLIVMLGRDFHAMADEMPKVAEAINEAIRRRMPK